jgi:hypothetical protein
LQNTLYMVVFEIIHDILFSLTTLYDGICQYPTISRCLNDWLPYICHICRNKKLLDTLFRSTPSRHLPQAVSRRLPAFELLPPFSSKRGPLVPLRRAVRNFLDSALISFSVLLCGDLALEAGQSEALTAYLKAIGRFHRYSLHNVLLIASQKPNASYVAGFRTWNELGRFVKKCEKGIMILAPIVRRKMENSDDDEKESFRIAGFRAAYVFDVSQTDGQDLPQN